MNIIKKYIFLTFIFILSGILWQCQIPDAPDTTPPLVAIIYPVNGQPVSGTVRIAVEAADETELSHVNLKIDGVARAQMRDQPFVYDWDTSPVADNQDHSLIAIAYDKSGNTTISPGVLVRVVAGPLADTLAPVITLVHPISGSTVKDTVVIVPQIIEDGAIDRIEYYIDGRHKFTSNQTPYQFNWDVSDLLNGSNHSIFARAFDINQNNSYSNVISVTIESQNIVDNTPPVVSINYPSTGMTVSDTVSILASASDNIAIDRLELFVDGSLYSTLNQSPWRFSWDVTGYISGSLHTVYIIAYDTNQNQTTSTIVNVTIQSQVIEDLTPPTIFISSPAVGAIVEGATTIVAEANDNISVTNVEFYIDGNLVGTDNTIPYEYIWDTSGLQSGSVHTLFAKAYDGAENSGQTALQTATISTAQIDNIPPTVTILYPTTGTTFTNGDTVSITADVEDNVGVQKVEFYIDGELLFTSTTVPYQYNWNTTGYGNGQSHSIYIKAFDLSGNIGAQLITVIVIP
ncbi:MAG: Ig-like domain-containing protein [Calditrichota bacterium]